MFGSLGYWASSKGMVAVPNLSGMTEAQASTALSNAVLSYSITTTVGTTNSSLVGKVAEQLTSAGTLVDYESVITIRLYTYVCISNWGQVEVSRTATSWSGNCNAGTEYGTYTVYYNNVDANGCSPSYTSSDSITTSRSCTPCTSLPNTVTRIYKYSEYSPGCYWRYSYDETRDGCGGFVSEVFVGKVILCE